MSNQWTSEIISKLHENCIKQRELAAYMGITPEYVSTVLNGKRKPRNAEEIFGLALENLIVEKHVSHPLNK